MPLLLRHDNVSDSERVPFILRHKSDADAHSSTSFQSGPVYDNTSSSVLPSIDISNAIAAAADTADVATDSSTLAHQTSLENNFNAENGQCIRSVQDVTIHLEIIKK